MNFKGILPVIVLFLLAMPVLATETSFKYMSSECSKNGSATIQFLHAGRIAYDTDLHLFITYDETGKTPVQGAWTDKFGKVVEFVKSDISNPDVTYFESKDGTFTKLGTYSLRLDFPKSADPSNTAFVEFQMDCPGSDCATNYQCRDDEICSNSTCLPLNCNSCQVGVANRCVARCNDNNPCTINLCNAGACSYEPIKNCCITDKDCSDKKACTVDACRDNKCQYSPVQCSASKDPCTRGICSEPNGCEYKTNPLCPLSNNTERKYVVNVGEPEITASSQSFLGKLVSLLSNLFK